MKKTSQKVQSHLKNSVSRTRSVFEQFPLAFTLLGAFGLVATFYGFEGIIDHIGVFRDNPFILLLTGVVILIFSGQLYKKLGS